MSLLPRSQRPFLASAASRPVAPLARAFSVRRRCHAANAAANMSTSTAMDTTAPALETSLVFCNVREKIP
jgi:hypothetical protein